MGLFRPVTGQQKKKKYLIKYYMSDQFKKNEMGGMCGMYRREWKCMRGFDGET